MCDLAGDLRSVCTFHEAAEIVMHIQISRKCDGHEIKVTVWERVQKLRQIMGALGRSMYLFFLH